MAIAECISVLTAMGFEHADAVRAVRHAGADVERATEFLSSEPSPSALDSGARHGGTEERASAASSSRAMPLSTSSSGALFASGPLQILKSSAPLVAQPSRQESVLPASSEAQAELEAMGFEASKVSAAVARFGSNVGAALNWILDAGAAAASSARLKGDADLVGLQTFNAATSLISDEIESMQLVHRAVYSSDVDSLREFLRMHPHLCNARDHRGSTPLALAYRLGFEDIVNFLLEHGADPRLKSANGWTVMQEAALNRQESVLMNMYLHQVAMQCTEWESSLAHLTAALTLMPDFYMEIRWEVTSWVPFIDRLAPSDTFQIWKKGDKLRFDSSSTSVPEKNRECATYSSSAGSPGRIGFLFSAADSIASARGGSRQSVFLVDFADHEFEDALLRIRNPPFEIIQREVASLMSNEVGKQEILVDRARYMAQNSLFGGQKRESLCGGAWDCAIGELVGLRFQISRRRAAETDSRAESAARAGAGDMPTFDDYFSGTGVAESGAAAAAESDIVSVDKEIEATVWLCDQFPLSRQDINTVMDIIAPVSADLARVKDIFALPMPVGFPVRLEIPVMPAIKASVAFTKFELVSCDESLFRIPADFRQRM